MAGEHGTRTQPWGTLEELLLVSAVNRHGTQSWDSVALEVGGRCSAKATTLLTALNCRDKFEDIKRRFVLGDDDDSSGSLGAMVDKLRRLRVEELRREVRRRDVSIVSLELKVKRLEEERERSLKEDAEATSPSKDLKRGGEDQRDGSQENLAGKMNSGEDFGWDFNSDDRENRSFNESNSTSQRGAAEKQAEGKEKEPGPEGNEPDPMRTKIRSEPDRDCSVNGKVAEDDDEDNHNNKNGDDTAKASQLNDSSELWESGGESKREGKRGRRGGATASRQQNSDVQSSASLSKRKRRCGGGGEGGGGGSRSWSRSSSGEEAEGDEVSPATSKGVKQLKLVKSEPLIKVLKIIRSHRLGSVFERRLRSQESERYKSLIRQHMDLRMIQSKLNKGVYTEDCIRLSFRDLLLLFNNAVVFFRKNSPEHNAAQELRSIVLKEMNDQLPKPQSATETEKSNVSKIEAKVQKLESHGSEKPIKSSIVVCGKLGSVNALSDAKNRKGDKIKEKAKAANVKKADGAAFVKVEDKGVRKRRTQERGGRRGMSTRGRNAAADQAHEYGVNELSSHDGLEALKAEKEKKENGRKKQGTARFLKRMTQTSSTEVKKENSDGTEEDSEESEDEKKKKKKKPTRGRMKPEVERKERVTRSSTESGGGRGGGRRSQESNGRGRRGVGRPPKRPETSAAGAGSGKRGRDNGEADQVGSAGRPRKRTRR
ncbi:LOW QUALITY PROTEIN: uncharacterized protein LOC103963872 [Pyrus x bretschneideri]|uniref:LOW QUALITY PROTEIN: uncharacterized protein LOC103963872 n=1 Tax=Pyrus x bretschneideri TaxID=225117 RepID=UPI00202F4722|nr:LOW QUALITY PROTEIN: uncharacterized protein LOC103963872 [Pyrus x bretschneideri]